MSALRLPVLGAKAPEPMALQIALSDPGAAHDVERLDLFLTEACNLACTYCFESHKPRKTPEIEQCERAIDWLMRAAAPKVHVTLWGGEPLLRKAALRHMVAYARDASRRAAKAVTFSMPTNGTLLDEETLEWIVEEEIALFLSIDGDADAQTTRPKKGGGSSYEMAMEGLRLAALHMPKLPPVRMTVTPENVEHLARSAAHLVERGARELMIYPAYDVPWSESALARYAASQLELAEWWMGLVRETSDPEGVPVLRAWRPTLVKLLEGVRPRRREGPIKQCGAGRELVAVAVDGSFVPCHRFPSYARKRDDDASLGRLETGLDEARREPFGAVRIEEMHGEVRCIECSIFDLCTYGCLAVSYSTTGRLDRVPVAACALMRAQVAACEHVHRSMAGDPRYARHLGRPLAALVREAAGSLGARALSLYRGKPTQSSLRSVSPPLADPTGGCTT